MDWPTVLTSLKRLVGKRLNSISGKSDVTVIEITDSKVVLKASKGSTVSVPLTRLKKIAEGMKRDKPIHVDSFMLGGGTRRNLPETLLANLEDVEWLRERRAKHIVWRGRKTHELGTLKQSSEEDK